jgi:hypothetical protein
MPGLPLAFTFPFVLAALANLPLLYFLLRITPPRPALAGHLASINHRCAPARNSSARRWAIAGWSARSTPCESISLASGMFPWRSSG